MVLEVYTGDEPLSATSARFAVTLQHRAVAAHDRRTAVDASAIRRPHVYESRSPDAMLNLAHKTQRGANFCSLHGACFCNRTMSWVEFGQQDDDVTLVSVTRVDGLVFPLTTRVLPLSARISCNLSADRRTASFAVRGTSKHLLLDHMAHDHHGTRRSGGSSRNASTSLLPRCDPASSFSHMMLVWVGGLDPPASLYEEARILRFPPGVHYLPGSDGVLQLPPAVDVILIQRGAWVMGRINVTRGRTIGSAPTPVRVVGHGIMDGSRYTYHAMRLARSGGMRIDGSDGARAARPEDALRFIEPQYDRPLMWDGPSLIRPQGHAAVFPPHSEVRQLRMLGWLFNEDGVWLGPNCSLRESFIRTNDDAIRIYGGSIDSWVNTPRPPRGAISERIEIRDVIVSHMWNGAVLQFGWQSAGSSHVRVSGLDVTHAEWFYHPRQRVAQRTEGGGTARSWENDIARAPNNAVLSLTSPRYDRSLMQRHSDIAVDNVRIDTPIGSFIRLGMHTFDIKTGTGGAADSHADSPSSSFVRGLRVSNVTTSTPLYYLRTAPGVTHAADQFVAATLPNSMAVHFSNVTIAGISIKSHSAWRMRTLGRAVNVTYD